MRGKRPKTSVQSAALVLINQIGILLLLHRKKHQQIPDLQGCNHAYREYDSLKQDYKTEMEN